MLTRYRTIRWVVCAVLLLGVSCVGRAAPKPSSAAQLSKSKQNLVKTLLQNSLFATSSGVDSMGKTSVVLYWKKTDGVIGYNLYRRDQSATDYPSTPLNGSKPIACVRTCDELKAIIPEGSPEWEMLSAAFAPPPANKSSGKNVIQAGNLKNKATLPTQQNPTPVNQPKQAMTINKDLTTIDKAAMVKPDIFLAALGPCAALARGLTAQEEARFDLMADANLKIRRARGLAFVDQSVTTSATYLYQLKGVLSDGTEILIAKDVLIQAGQYMLPDPPSGIGATAGDSKVLVTWNRDPVGYGYAVGRSTTAGGPFIQIHTEPIIFDVETDLDGKPISTPKPGFVDFQRWDDEGAPTSHVVTLPGGLEVHVYGPTNGTKYWYAVACTDILGRRGDWSTDTATATPQDKTAPKSAENLKVDPVKSPVGLAITWRKVTMDVAGHQELGTTQTYNIYRSSSLDALDNIGALKPTSSLFVHSVTANPSDPATMSLSWTDTSSVLVPPYGEKDFFYRVQCVDAQGNVGPPSAAVSGRAPDMTPPGGTHVTGAEGFADHIRVTWEANSEPDLAGYQIYVGPCDKGKPYRPKPTEQAGGVKAQDRYPCDFALVGEILLEEAKRRHEETGQIYFDDFSLPPGSPLCYAYWVRAFDFARNVYSGSSKSGCPEDGEYVCQRMYEDIAPPFPIVSALTARNDKVVVEWMASPIQDLRAFHVYRSEREDGPLTFVGGVLTDGTVLAAKWPGVKPKCGDIPAEPNPTAVRGLFEDKNVRPNTIYFYRVSAVDWLGNESESADLAKIPASSTFTYTKDLPTTPTVSPMVAAPAEGCGFVVKWTPAFDAAKHQGFMVFRSTDKSGPFRQVSGILTENQFTDKTVIRGLEYWYRVQAVDKLGMLSEPSPAVLYKY